MVHDKQAGFEKMQGTTSQNGLFVSGFVHGAILMREEQHVVCFWKERGSEAFCYCMDETRGGASRSHVPENARRNTKDRPATS